MADARALECGRIVSATGSHSIEEAQTRYKRKAGGGK